MLRIPGVELLKSNRDEALMLNGVDARTRVCLGQPLAFLSDDRPGRVHEYNDLWIPRHDIVPTHGAPRTLHVGEDILRTRQSSGFHLVFRSTTDERRGAAVIPQHTQWGFHRSNLVSYRRQIRPIGGNQLFRPREDAEDSTDIPNFSEYGLY